MEKDEAGRCLSHRDSRYSSWEDNVIVPLRLNEHGTFSIGDLEIKTDVLVSDCSSLHSVKVHAQCRDGISNIESARNINWHNRGLSLTWRSYSAKPSADRGKHGRAPCTQGLS